MPFLELDGEPSELAGETVVGSGSKASLRIQGKDLAARHFTLDLYKDGTAKVRPASSQEVVILNGRQVPAAGAPLSSGDVIGAGAARFVFLSRLDARRPALAEAAGEPYLVDAKARTGHPLRTRIVQIGREAGCAIVLRDPRVSRYHADVRAEGGEYILYSTGAGGTRVNGAPVQAPRMLEDGDEVQIGDTVFRFARTALPEGVRVVERDELPEDALSRSNTVMHKKLKLDVAADARAVYGRRYTMPLMLGAMAALAVAAFLGLR